MPQPHGVAKTPSHNTTQFSRDYFHFTWSSRHPQRCRPLPALWGVLRIKREHKAISRTAGLHSTVATSRQTHRTTVRDKAKRLARLAPAFKSIHGGQRIHWLRSHILHPRKAHRLVSGGEMWKGRGAGRWTIVFSLLKNRQNYVPPLPPPMLLCQCDVHVTCFKHSRY